jgi:hypothetical protein
MYRLTNAAVFLLAGMAHAVRGQSPKLEQVTRAIADVRSAMLGDTTSIDFCQVDALFGKNGTIIYMSNVQPPPRYRTLIECKKPAQAVRQSSKNRLPEEVKIRSMTMFKDSVIVTGTTRRGSSTIRETYAFSLDAAGDISFREYRITGLSQD